MTSSTARAEQASCCDDRQDVDWGRLPGAAPPLRWWLPAAVAAVAALVLTLVVVLVVRPPGPLDNPTAGDQRDGLLDDGPVLPERVSDVAFGGRPVVVLFDREQPGGAAYERWRATVADDGVDLVVKVGAEGDALAEAIGMPTPVDGGRPIGYAVVDPTRTVRYATLDPVYPRNAFEIDVITGAVADADR